jgi:hypothetical protein
MRQLTTWLLLIAFSRMLLAQGVIEKCSTQTPAGHSQNIVPICELLSKSERYANRHVTVRGRFLGGHIDSPSTLFGDECRGKSVEVADPQYLEGSPKPEIVQHGDLAEEEQNRRDFYSLGMSMCPGHYVGDFIPVEGTFTGLLMVKKSFRVRKDGSGNGFGFRGRARVIFVIRSVADTCRVNDCPSPVPSG